MFFSQLFRRKNLFFFSEHEFGGHKLGAIWSPHQRKDWGHFPIGESLPKRQAKTEETTAEKQEEAKP